MGIGADVISNKGKMSLAPVHNVTLHERAYLRIRQGLISGYFESGQQLTIRALAADLGTSETPIREAVRRLITEGALEGVPNKSIRVPVLTPAMWEDVRSVRCVLEGHAVAIAVTKLTTANLEELAQLNRGMKTAIDDGEIGLFYQLNREFHSIIYESTESPLLCSILDSLWLKSGPVLAERFIHGVGLRNAVECHDRAIAAFRVADVDGARCAIQDDINDAAKGVIASMTDVTPSG